jgi:2-dehydropantoate 2-reductase
MIDKSTTSPTGPLRIAVLGVGGIGSTFAFNLARVGNHAVTAIARAGSVRLKQLREAGGIRNSRGERADVAVADTLDETVPYDLIIVTVLDHHVDALLPALKRSAAARIQFMFNTFDPERLRDAVGAERCSFGMPFVQASIDENGVLTSTIGRSGQKSKMDHQRSVEVFNASGLPAIFEPDMLLWLRCHVPLCIALESVSFRAMRRGSGASWSDALLLARGVKESFRLIQRLGYPLYPSGKARLAASPTWVIGTMLWALSRVRSFRELLATGVLECRALVDVLAAVAPRANPPASVDVILAMKP